MSKNPTPTALVTPGTPGTPAGERELEWVSEEIEGSSFRTEHFRTVDSLGALLRTGAINQPMHDAGQEFGRAFVAANLSPTATAALERIGAAGPVSVTERAAHARIRVNDALVSVGGSSSPGGSAVWFVAGTGMSVREWSIRWAWNGRAINAHEAKGILVGALGMLAVHYRFATA
jgi:hypothetical protein